MCGCICVWVEKCTFIGMCTLTVFKMHKGPQCTMQSKLCMCLYVYVNQNFNSFSCTANVGLVMGSSYKKKL